MMLSVLIILLALGAANVASGQVARDCQELQATSPDALVSGVYPIQPLTYPKPFFVYCDFKTDGGGWTVIQRRVDPDSDVDFNQPWSEYKRGFGDLAADFWLGNEKISNLTTQCSYELRIELTGKTDTPRYAKYSSFRVGAESIDYQLFLGTYSGNAGQDSLDYHRGQFFTTSDEDHDEYSSNCASRHGGGWWFKSCDHSNLNGEWGNTEDLGGIEWTGHPGGSVGLTFTEMKIRAA